MNLDIGSNEVDVTNAHDYRTSLSHIVKVVYTITKEMDVEYILFLGENEHTLVWSKQQLAFLEASLAKQKSDMGAKWENITFSFAENLRISNELNDA